MRVTIERLAITGLVLMLSGCASIIPQPIRSAPADSPSLTQARSQPDADVNKAVRWGGIIARVDNQQTETWVEIVDKPLGWDGAPLDSDRSQGRFIARFNSFLDPVIYERGRLLTVYGTLEPTVVSRIGEFTYLFPVVQVQEWHLWPRRPDVMYYEPWPLWYDPWYPRPFPYHYGPPYFY